MSGDRQSHAKTSLEPYKQASYPYVLKSHFSKFNGKTASFVGKIKNNTGDKLVLTNKDGKSNFFDLLILNHHGYLQSFYI